MSGQYKDGKKVTQKAKTPKRKNAKELYVEQNMALLDHKINLLQKNIVDDFLDDQVRGQKIYERALDLVNLHPFEMLTRLAATELHLEATLFLYEETFKQKQFLETSYNKVIEKQLRNAVNKSTAKEKINQKYVHMKEVARQILDDMEQKDFKIFCRKMRAKFPMSEISNSAIRNYFKEITGLKSTK
jgi:hypothetical protein